MFPLLPPSHSLTAGLEVLLGNPELKGVSCVVSPIVTQLVQPHNLPFDTRRSQIIPPDTLHDGRLRWSLATDVLAALFAGGSDAVRSAEVLVLQLSLEVVRWW